MRIRTQISRIVVGVSVLTLGCGGEAPTRRTPRAMPAPVVAEPAAAPAIPRPGTTAPSTGGDQDDVKMSFERGYLSDNDVYDALERHQGSLAACYERAGDARKYVAGDVVLRFFVGATGRVADVLVVGSTLGHYAVERCLVVEGRNILFKPPGGSKDTEFEYSLKFRSSGEIPVVESDAQVMAKDVGAQSSQLHTCGWLGATPVRAVAYVKPGGTVASVGLASAGPLNPEVAMCMIEQIRTWKLPDDRTHIVRTTFPLAATAGSSKARSESRRSSRRGRR